MRVGVVGCGGISASHLSGYANLSQTEIVAVCDINETALHKRADEFEVRGRYTNYQQMLDQEGLDLVSICTHAPFHMPIAVAAAERGINVLSEKPLAVDLVQADRMLSACTRAGVHLAVSHQFRFTPIFRQVKRWVDGGRIGQLRSIREVGKGREAGFELMEMGVHYFDEIDFFLGGIEWVHAQISYQGHSATIEDIMHSSQLCQTDRRDNGTVAGDTMLVHVGGKNGTYGEIELYCRPEQHGWMMGPHLLGSRGQMMVKPNAKTGIDEIWYCPFDVSFANQTPDWELVPFDEALFLIEGKAWPSRHTIWSIQNVVTAIREGQQPELSGKQALVSLECVSATYESHFTAARVNLPMTDRQHPLEKRQNTKIEKENGE